MLQNFRVTVSETFHRFWVIKIKPTEEVELPPPTQIRVIMSGYCLNDERNIDTLSNNPQEITSYSCSI